MYVCSAVFITSSAESIALNAIFLVKVSYTSFKLLLNISCDFGVIIKIHSGTNFIKVVSNYISIAMLLAESDRDKDSDGYDQVGLNQCNSTSPLL